MSLDAKTKIFFHTYRHILASRELDLLELDYTQRGEAFFHVSGAGHENIAFLNDHLIPEDYLHCHYRDKSLMLARGISVKQFFLSLFCKDQSHSRGRQMSAHLSDHANRILSMVGPVGNNALQAVGVASVIKNQPENPLVLCGLGDGTTQQGEVLEAIAHAVRDTLPVLFVVEDNTWAISTKTQGRTFYSLPDGETDQFYGIPITYINGRDPEETWAAFGKVVNDIRSNRKPAIVVFKVARLHSHTNADDHRTYRTQDEIEQTKAVSDPVTILEEWLVNHGVDRQELEILKAQIRESVLQDSIEAQNSPDPEPIHTAKAPLSPRLTDPTAEYLGTNEGEQITMLESIREVLAHRMGSDERIRLFGEDLEDPKGDVFGVTRGLSKAYPGRVVNSPLAEASIVGIGLGQALAGERPVAFLQFADFFPLAWNQIVSELGSMWWRTDGSWPSSMIIMATAGGFKPGLGPFHASSMESVAVHTPGVDVFYPSTAADAAGLLNAAFDSGRPTVFFYPKSLLNDRTKSTSQDVTKQFVPLGKARKIKTGTDLTMVGWGNTIPLLEKAANALEQAGLSVDLFDLRSLSPWDEDGILNSVRITGHLIVAQEDNSTSSMAAEIIAVVSERTGVPCATRRVSRQDTFVPCNFANQLEVLPSYQRILEQAVDLLGGTVQWTRTDQSEEGFAFVEAVGSSPSDESVTVVEWKVQPGDALKPGMMLGEMEADKAAFEMSCPMAGTLHEILVPVGDMVKVGTPMLKVAIEGGQVSKKPLTQENPGIPSIELPKNLQSVNHALEEGDKRAQDQNTGKQDTTDQLTQSQHSQEATQKIIGLAGIAIAPGSRLVTNQEIAESSPTWEADDIYKRIGIESRYWASAEEDTLSLAVRAARKLLEEQHISPSELTAVICTSGTAPMVTPSLACLVLDALGETLETKPLVPAWDINAACSGYLYALQAAYDHLFHNPNGMALVITSEVLSRRTDPQDESTAPIFGDAATATLVVGHAHRDRIQAILDRPVLAAKAENGENLSVPLPGPEAFIAMNGPKVYLEAVAHMRLLLEQACQASGIGVSELDLVVPHQANQRIINAVRQKAHVSEDMVYSNIRNYGNTSSSSIPLALVEILLNGHGGQMPKTIGLTAFGGGFTFAGAVLRIQKPL